MKSIRLKARAKVNLALDVVRRRDDGYHEVRMIMQSIRLYDMLYMKKTSKNGEINIKTNLSYLPVNENNLVYKAVKLMFDTYNINAGINIELEKFIPVAAGMAGGSSDAAATMVGVNRLFDIGASQEELMHLGVKIGADVPFCIMRGTVLAEGIGEVLTPLKKAPDMHIVVAKPPINVSTKFVYEHLKLDEPVEHPDVDGMIEAINNQNVHAIASKLSNVLESVTIAEYPVIEEIKNVMKANGALNAIMSGSGPTVFGIYDDETQAKKCVEVLKSGNLAKQIYLTGIF